MEIKEMMKPFVIKKTTYKNNREYNCFQLKNLHSSKPLKETRVF